MCDKRAYRPIGLKHKIAIALSSLFALLSHASAFDWGNITQLFSAENLTPIKIGVIGDLLPTIFQQIIGAFLIVLILYCFFWFMLFLGGRR